MNISKLVNRNSQELVHVNMYSHCVYILAHASSDTNLCFCSCYLCWLTSLKLSDLLADLSLLVETLAISSHRTNRYGAKTFHLHSAHGIYK